MFSVLHFTYESRVLVLHFFPKFELGSTVNSMILRFNANSDDIGVSIKVSFFLLDALADPCVQQSCPLDDNSGQHKVVGDCTEAILLQECHQETETKKHHDVHILEFYGTTRRKITSSTLSYLIFNLQTFSSETWNSLALKCANLIQILKYRIIFWNDNDNIPIIIREEFGRKKALYRLV